MDATLATTARPSRTTRLSRFVQRQGWTVGVAVLFVVLLLWRVSQLPDFGDFEIRTITAGTMPLAFLAMAQGVIVISGGIDLSVGAMMVFANCLVGAVDGGSGPRHVPAPRGRRAGRHRRPVDGHRPRHHGVGRSRHHRHAGGQLHPRRPGAVRHRRPGRRHVTGLPADRRRRPVEPVAVGAVDRRRPRSSCGCR